MTYTPGTLIDPVAALNAEFAKIKTELDVLAAAASTSKTRSARVSVPALAAGAPNYVDVAVTWPTAFADTNYTVVVTVEEDVSPGYYTAFNRQVLAKTAAGCKVRVETSGPALTAGQATVHTIAIHD